ncbi:MAG: serine/threonine protein kinase [Anaerolineales bacterium]|uniref:serine/threonine protein kinase n=1 Tax=Candidatus Villigracilis affinis TaxID=3140682 RepID=UPI002A1AEC1E|nr:serine/threonine protein kinase [Anaerolineales bacterium]MBL0348598.1 serine/threonine protein kinase [Anaerolineales bacterium]
MITNPITSETSLKSRPALRRVLLAVWAVIVLYTVYVLGEAIAPHFNNTMKTSMAQNLLGISSLLQTSFYYIVDILLVLGFSVIGVMIVMHSSDDWFAIFTSIFLITFGVRVTDLANMIALQPGTEFAGGLLLAMGDIGIVLFTMLFPDGKFTPRWLRFAVPPLVIMMLGIYLFPNAPFFWDKLGQSYLLITTSWYLVGFFTLINRYFRRATLAHKQQIRWVFIGTLGPFLWFIIFQVGLSFLPEPAESSLAMTAILLVSRLLSIFLFLMLPLSISISIAQTKLFNIDLIINRSLVYGTLTLALGLTFAVMLALISLVFKNFNQGDQSLVAATIFSVSAGALFQPARKKLQRFVDRFFYHIEIDYQKTPSDVLIAPDASSTAPKISSYYDLKLIGRGGMAEVYRATSPSRNKSVAIKVLRAALADDDSFRKRFMREAEIISRLEHPNIVNIIDFGDENGIYHIVMEHLSGPDLNNLIKQEKQITLPKTISILRGVADALDYAHKNGLVHRDIKPSNVMLDSSTIPARVVLTDFGIAKIIDSQTLMTNTNMLGTLDYIAPEQIQASAEVDSRADIYALGVMTYQMITGTLPFEHPSTGALLLAHLNAPPPDARALVRDLPRNVAHSIQQAMAKKPENRPATAGEFIATLENT